MQICAVKLITKFIPAIDAFSDPFHVKMHLRDPSGGASSAPPDLLAGGEVARCMPPPNNLSPTIGLWGRFRPFGLNPPLPTPISG